MKIYVILVLTFINIYSLNAQHHYPEFIATEVKIALSHYPDLADVPIEFKFKSKIKKSTMRAQPSFWSIFCGKSKRSYKVLISESFKIADTVYYTKDMPSKVLTGWLGHELGHVMDYQHRSGLNLIGIGLGYLFSEKVMKKVERSADTYAVKHGMEKYILATKNFILNEAGFPENYTNRIKRFYLSPEEIMVLVEERKEKEKRSL